MFEDIILFTDNFGFQTAWASDILKLIFFTACLMLIFTFVKLIIKWRI